MAAHQKDIGAVIDPTKTIADLVQEQGTKPMSEQRLAELSATLGRIFPDDEIEHFDAWLRQEREERRRLSSEG